MEWSAVRYWRSFVRRGEEIEVELKHLKTMQCRPTATGKKVLLTGTVATYLLYGLSLLGWVFSLFWMAWA
jgi:hypothetical protein